MKELWGRGDKGLTSIATNLVSKDSPIIQLLGSIDEISANIGYLICYLESFSQQKVQLSEILKDLFDIGASVSESANSNFDFRRLKLLESWTLELNLELKPITKFIMPTGNKASCVANITRTVVRRSEVNFFAYYSVFQKHEDVGRYLNRLSDYLFVLTRFINAKYDLEDYYK